jgi:prolyl-tRNA synthetase
MRLSTLFGRTLRETPAEAEMVSHQLLLRAAMIRQLAAGIYSYLPMGWRVLRKIEQIMREEMDAIDGQEMLMPVVNPAEIWQATGRWYGPAPGPSLVRFKDRGGRDMVLAITHEEATAYLLRNEIFSYRQLPVMVYHIQTKFRDEPRSRGGLVRVREFTMKDAYSCHTTYESLDEYYPRMHHAYENIFRRCGLEVSVVEADTGVMGGATSHEFMVVSESGEDTLIICPECGYAANAERATFVKPPRPEEPEKKIEKIPTPGTTTIEEVAALVGVPTSQTLKAVFYSTDQGEVIIALIRGDLDVNEVKLSNQLGGAELRAATEEEVEAAGIVAGYASPVGLTGARVVADDSVQIGSNFVAGANEEGFHLANVNYPRDFQVETLADIALARKGDACPHCGSSLTDCRGIEVGHLFKLGTKYSEGLNATFLDKEGQARPIVMGSYGIGTGRLMAAIIEQHHDDKGIVWPASVAPALIHLVSLSTDRPEVVETAERVYQQLQEWGYSLLYDDRDESAGVKFNDADLIGVPLRLTISPRMLKKASVEAKLRWEEGKSQIPLEDLQSGIEELISA